VWCGFQTGNFLQVSYQLSGLFRLVLTTASCVFQLSLALARLFSGPPGFRDLTFHKADQQALCSLITFNMGAFIGRIGDKMGPKSRSWLILGTLIQTLFTMAAAVCIWKSGEPNVASERGDPAWNNALSFVTLGFMSASVGLQGIMGKRMNTQFTTTGKGSLPPFI
jgi:hypothetical protein